MPEPTPQSSSNGANRAIGMLLFLLPLAAVGCGGTGSAATTAVSSDPNVAAVQKALDAHPVAILVPTGHQCDDGAFGHILFKRYARYQGAPGLTIRVEPVQHDIVGPGSGISRRCWDFSWTSSDVHPRPGDPTEVIAVLGRYVVDKVGAGDGYGNYPFKAHFETNPLGAFAEKVDLQQEHGTSVRGLYPMNANDSHAIGHKDADGKLVIDSGTYGTQR